jgi:membrane fusion protein (multidrug efflux system)
MSANISAVLGERANAVTIPNEAVFSSGRDAFVFLVKADSTVTRIPLTLGTRMEKEVEIVAGLDPDAIVVRAGHQKLFEGAKVLPVTSRPDSVTH